MAFIPPEIGVRVKNRFAYSEIHTFLGILASDRTERVKTS
jgi:hypothetical protein